MRTEATGDAPKSPTDPQEPLRYAGLPALRAATPMLSARFAQFLAEHQAFLAAGGAGGRWETFVVTSQARVYGQYAGLERIPPGQANLAYERLDGLDLRQVRLPYANLVGVTAVAQDFSDADLTGSLITDADLTGACFRGACLAGADLSRSEMRACDLRDADLRNADLEYADLSLADMRGARLDGARFHRARLGGAVWEMPGLK